jgi:ADP-ribosylglycohydrolase
LFSPAAEMPPQITLCPRPKSDSVFFMTSNLRDKFDACIWGGAIGDAFGAPVEMFSQANIIKKTGNPDGLMEMPPLGDTTLSKSRPAGSITDDTSQLALTLIAGTLAKPSTDRAAFLYRSWQSYLQWGARQEGAQGAAAFFDPAITWPDFTIPFLETGGGGRNTIAGLLEGRPGSLQNPLIVDREFRGKRLNGPNSGCGGMMRIAPVAFMTTPDDVFQLATENAAITHGMPDAYNATGMIAQFVADSAAAGKITLNAPKDESLAALFSNAAACARTSRFNRAIIDSFPGAIDNKRLFSARSIFAQVCYVLFSAQDLESSSDNFKKTLRLAVNITGDSDSVAAMCGNVLGAAWGMKAIPADWQSKVKQKAEITSLINWAAPQHGLY